mmetsp:Transcript_58464/g.190653  ORF Transcript_58464/g.190653 Transcript_58464/m.190653 type:complete len:318 (-) Transcript_58464:999-1952(-)
MPRGGPYTAQKRFHVSKVKMSFCVSSSPCSSCNGSKPPTSEAHCASRRTALPVSSWAESSEPVSASAARTQFGSTPLRPRCACLNLPVGPPPVDDSNPSDAQGEEGEAAPDAEAPASDDVADAVAEADPDRGRRAAKAPGTAASAVGSAAALRPVGKSRCKELTCNLSSMIATPPQRWRLSARSTAAATQVSRSRSTVHFQRSARALASPGRPFSTGNTANQPCCAALASRATPTCGFNWSTEFSSSPPGGVVGKAKEAFFLARTCAMRRASFAREPSVLASASLIFSKRLHRFDVKRGTPSTTDRTVGASEEGPLP